MTIEATQRKIRIKHLIFFPVLILIFFIIINVFLKPICLTNSSSPTIMEITSFVDPLCENVPKWFNYITPTLNYKEARKKDIIISLIIVGLAFFSAKQLDKANKEKNRLGKIKQEIDDEDLRNEFRKKK